METSRITGPQLTVDRETCISNIERMKEKVAGSNISFRPHFKTHQSITIGRWFREKGISRITVSSIKMAYYFAGDGWKDILVAIAYNPREYGLYEKLADKCKLCLTISCPEAAAILSKQCRVPIDVMIKVDTGYNRSGIVWNDKSGLRLIIDNLMKNKNIDIRGFMTHDGSTYAMNNPEQIMDEYKVSVNRLKSCRDNSGLDRAIISAGDTPSASIVDELGDIDEIRPGNFVFFDLMQYLIGSCSFNQIATALMAPVIDIRRSQGLLVVHAGAVHLSKDSIVIDNRPVYGMVADYDDSGWQKPEVSTYITSLSQEHGIIKFNEPDRILKYKPGDLLAIIPVHSCLTADCMGRYMLDNGELIDHMSGIPQESVFSLL